MHENIQAELKQIKDAIMSAVDPVTIYLFGSYAYGTPHEDSDIDIYAVVPDSVPDTTELCAKIRLALCKTKKRPLDLLLTRQSVFERKKDSYFFEKKIATQGIKIYEN